MLESDNAINVREGVMQYILTDVPKYGWLCKIHEHDQEIYRGEFHLTYFEAMEKALEWQEDRT